MGKIDPPCCQEELRTLCRWVVGRGPLRSRRSVHAALLLASLSVHQRRRCQVHFPAERACCQGGCVSRDASAVGVHERYLCPVVPLVAYHGERSWTEARSLAELVRAPSGLDEYQVDFRCPLLDLSQLTDEEIAGEPLLRSTL